MERIDRSTGSSSAPSSRTQGKLQGKQPTAATFTGTLEKSINTQETSIASVVQDPADDADLEFLLDEIHEIGEQVKQDPLPGTVSSYKTAVRRFMNLVVQRSLDVLEQTSSPNILKQKKFTLVRVIDEKLERLAAGVLSTQREAFDILGKIDEINGLLVNLMS